MGSDARDTSIFVTTGDALPTSADRFSTELVDLRAELSAQMSTQTEGILSGIRAQNEKFNVQICTQNEKFEQKFETMFQAFME